MNERTGTDAAAASQTDLAPVNLPTWLNEPCPVWCDNSHTDVDLDVDRRHMGTMGSVALTTMQYEKRGDRFLPPSLDINLWRHYRETEPRVSIELDTGDEATPFLTLAEARRFLLAMAATVADVLPDDYADALAVLLPLTIVQGRIEKSAELATPECLPWCEEHNTGCHRDRAGEYGEVLMTHADADEGTRFWVIPSSPALTEDEALALALDVIKQVAAARMLRAA